MRETTLKTSLRTLTQAGFTLVELLIVVIILAILAAVVIPQFASSTVDARESALDANLAAMRGAIELYRAQHGVYPGAVTAVGVAANCTGGTIGAGTIGTTPAVMEQLTTFSNAAGETCSLNVGSASRFGPYLRRGIPNDPITSRGSLAADIITVGLGTPLVGAAAATGGGWKYDTVSGQIIMNSIATDSNGRTYSLH